jgi:hypothetical protein
MMRAMVLVLAMSAAAGAQVTAKKSATPRAEEREILLPVRSVALYTNGVGFFVQSGKVTGDELVRIDLTTAQLNDVLQSLTAVDLGGGKIVGGSYGTTEPLGMQLDSLAPGLGPDPTVTEFLQAIKGAHVEVRSGTQVFSGRLLNVEVRREPEGKGSAVLVERRYVSVISDAGGLRTFELTPSVEVRLTGKENKEIGRYLQLLATSHNPELRHLTLEDKGMGERELHVSYLSAVPAWKSSYRILFTGGAAGAADKTKQTATLQGWAVVDNTSGTDWQDVSLTLVSGAPRSFIQQISRPLDVERPEIAMRLPGGPKTPQRALMGRAADPLDGRQAESVAVNTGAIGGGMVEVRQSTAAPVVRVDSAAVQAATPVKDYEAGARKSLEADATPVDLDDLFEYKLAKPVTIRRGESTTVPILQAEVGAERVTVWNPREHPGAPMRSLWLTNTSGLTLNRGSFSVVENGMFGGEGQVDLLHPKERRLVPYALDEAVTVEFKEGKREEPKAQRIEIVDGRLTVHRDYPRLRTYTIHNTGSSARTVVLEAERTDHFQMSPGDRRLASVWHLDPSTPAPVEMTATEYRFEVEVPASGTTEFKLLEGHTHPVHYEIARMSEAELQGILREANGNAEIAAKLQPLIDARHRLADLDAKLKANQRAMDSVKFEEKRIRENMAALTGASGEGSLSKRYAEEMNEQEDKMADLRKEKDALVAQQDAVQKEMADKLAGVRVNAVLRA